MSSQKVRAQAKLSFDAEVKDFESAEKYAEFMAKQGRPVITHEPPPLCQDSCHLCPVVSGRYITKDQRVATHKQVIEISNATYEFNKHRRGARPVNSEDPKSPVAD